jgi:hypothetical protein
MNGFVRIGPHHADLVVRVPLDLLRAVPLPVAHGDYDLAASGPAVKTAVNALSRGLALWEDRLRLLPVKAEGQLAPLDDRSFEDYEHAIAGVASPLPPDTRIGYELGYLDAHFVYPIGSPHSVFAIESVIGADLGDTVKLAIRFIPLDGASRALMIAGGAGRIALDPAWWEAPSALSGSASSTSSAASTTCCFCCAW